jgi:subtilisin
VPALGPSPGFSFELLDSIGENGAKLIEIAPQDLARLRRAQPGLRVAPLIEYEPCLQPLVPRVALAVQPAAPSRRAGFSIRSTTGQPIEGVHIIAFTDFQNRQGAEAFTDEQGQAQLYLSSAARFDRVYVLPRFAFWPKLLHNVSAAASLTIDLAPITFPVNDALRAVYGNAAAEQGEGVVVGVIDTGCGPHRQLAIAGGFNAVGDPGEFHDIDQHGTHVAGIIAARGGPSQGVRGVAPAATLRSYRVFARSDERTTNFDIGKAVDRARQDGCDLLNLSLKQSGSQVADDVLRAAIEDARNAGLLPIAAAGNDDRAAVAFPASDDLCIAVTAMGRVGTFPGDSVSAGTIANPRGNDPDDFLASFSNVGPQVDLTAPGVGIVSTVPEDQFAVMDGTSMACPVVTGIGARLMAANQGIMAMNRDATRSAAIAQLLLSSAVSLGFGALFEGDGRPRP